MISEPTPRPQLGACPPGYPVVLDTNVFINALAGRGPAVLRVLLKDMPSVYVAAPARAELTWVCGRLDPNHPDTQRVLDHVKTTLDGIHPEKVLVPSDADWLAAGELAGSAARVASGGGRRISTAFDRVELISDALTAIVAHKAGLTIITEDVDFELLGKLVPGLSVLFYDRVQR